MLLIVTLTFVSELRLRMPVPYSVRYTGVSTPRLIGTEVQPELAHWNTGTGDCICGLAAWVRIAVAAATPLPVLFALKSVGTTDWIVPPPVCVVVPFVTTKLADPGAVPSGTTKLICGEDT